MVITVVVAVTLSSMAGGSPARAAATDAAPRPTPVTAFPANVDRWMAEYGPVIAERPLTSVVFPGTHDSGTASIDALPVTLQSGSEFDVLRTALPAAWAFGALPGLILSSSVRAWSVTQNRSIIEQLNDGVRYLDLRFCWDASTQKTRICHGAFGADVPTTIDEIAAFINAPDHGREIVIVDIKDVDLKDVDRRNAMWKTIADKLGTHIAEPPTGSLSTYTVGDLWEKRQQVILLSDDRCATESCKNVWHRSTVADGPWKSVRTAGGGTKTYSDDDLLDDAKIEERMQLGLENRDASKFLILGTPLTPNSAYQINKTLSCIDAAPDNSPCSLYELGRRAAYRTDLAMTWWANNEHAAPRNMNILNVDAYETTNVVPYAIRMNAGPVMSWRWDIASGPLLENLSKWTGEAVTLKVGCETEPRLPLDYPSGGTTNADIDHVVAAGSTFDASTGSASVTAANAKPTVLECYDEFGKPAVLRVPPLPALTEVSTWASRTAVTAGDSVTLATTGRYDVPLDSTGTRTSPLSQSIDDVPKYTAAGPSGVARACDRNVCRLTEAGTNTITASAPAGLSRDGVARTSTATVQVTPGAMNGIALSPPNATIPAGGSQQYRALAVDAFGNVRGDVNPASVAIMGAGATCVQGKCTATKVGSYDITTRYLLQPWFSARATLTVTPGPATSNIVIAPPNATVVAGQPQRFTVSTIDAYGNPVADVTQASNVMGSFGACPAASCTITKVGTYRVVVGVHRDGSAAVRNLDSENRGRHHRVHRCSRAVRRHRPLAHDLDDHDPSDAAIHGVRGRPVRQPDS